MSWTSGGAAACAAVFAIACAGAPAPGPVAVSTPEPPADAAEVASEPLELRTLELPASGRMRAADDSGERFVQGGVRFELHGERVELATELARVELVAHRVGDAWLFVDRAHGRVLRSDTFLGALTPHGEADTTDLTPCIGDVGARLWMLGADGLIYSVSAETPLTPVPALADRVSRHCDFTDASHGHVSTTLGWTQTTDGGATWSTPTPGPMPPAVAARLDVLDRDASIPRDVAERLARANLASLGLAPGDHDVRPPPLPERRCRHASLHVAVCPSGVYVAAPEAETWMHVAAADDTHATTVASADGERVLLGWGCRGEEGRLCLIEHDPPSATSIERALGLSEATAFVGDTIYLRAERGVLAVDLESGETRALTLPRASDHESFMEGLDVLPDGTVFLQALARGDGEQREAMLYRAPPGETTPRRVELPPRTTSVAMFDARRGFSVDVVGVVHRTDDGGASWAPTELRHGRGARRSDAIRCSRQSCRGDAWIAVAVPPDTPAPTAFVRPGPRPVPHSTLRCEPTASAPPTRAAVEHEVRRNKLHVTVLWETPSGSARAAGFLRGESADGFGWEVLAHTDALALVAFSTDAGRRRVVLATARGRVRLLETGSDLREPVAVETRTGELVALLPEPHRIDARGRVTRIATVTAGEDARFTAVRSDAAGDVEVGWWAPTRSGAVRVVTASGRAEQLGAGDEGVTACESAAEPTRWWLRGGGVALPLMLGLGELHRRRVRTDVVVDVDAQGGACVRSIVLDGAPTVSTDGTFTTRYGNVCRVSD